jgi:hypothetical protein
MYDDALKAIEGCPEIAVVMTGNISRPIEWNEHIRTQDATQTLKKFEARRSFTVMFVICVNWI